ncbi:MAG TPA: hypothetical protein DEB06_08495 [Phycisphaerales bacterium]|nr:hypothetical protein [Phycisphaerales bacterium]
MRRGVVSLFALGALASAGFAHGEDVDIGVRVVAGALETFGVSDVLGSTGDEPVERVFAGELGSIEFGPNGIDDPGFFADTLTDGTAVGFNIRAALGRWNGAGFDLSISETMTIARFFGSPGQIDAASGVGFVPGFTLATASGGGFDEHPVYILNGPGGTPADGVYLLELEVTSPALQTSLPLWIVFNLNTDEAIHDEAIEWVEANLVPSPGVLAAAPLALGARRRRR